MAIPSPSPAVQQTIVGDHNIVTGTGDVRIVYQLPPAEAEDRRGLLVVLQRVRQFWIDDVLERSMQGVAALELGRAAQSDAVAHPWAQVIELPAPGRQPVTGATVPLEASFDQAGRALLILGAEGSGKTTALLQLARALITRAERDPTQPIPVVLNLVSWTRTHGALLPWLVSELQSKYYVPAGTARAWITHQRLALLLDGLDEVDEPHRAACVAAINRFLREVGSAGLVVCSRLDEYRALPERLALGGAVRIEPLSAEQVVTYVSTGGDHLDSLRSALDEDGALREMATTPLLLSVMTLAYRDAAAAPRATEASLEGRRARLFDTYVRRMFARRAGVAARYAPAQTVRWLGALARQMLREGQRVLLVEGLQPSWLATHLQRVVYVILSRALMGLALGAMEGVYLYALKQAAPDPRLAALGFGTVLGAGVRLGVLFALVAATVDGLRFALLRDDRPEPREPWPITAVVVAVYWTAFTVLLAVLGIGTWRSPFGLIWALLFALRGRGQTWRTDVRPVLGLGWSRRLALRGAVWGVLTGLAVGVFAVVLTTERGGLVYLLLYGVLGAAFGGVTRTVGTSPVPGRGIALTVRAALRGGVLTGGVSGGLFGGLVVAGLTVIWASSGVHPLATLLTGAGLGVSTLALIAITAFAGLITGVLVGLYFGLLGALWYGGADALQHLVLRVLLSRADVPWRLSHFLDHCTQLIFLQRVGGGYRFVHGMLMTHFAAGADRALESS
ncbi:MAG TPA: NACHT domain-containing protein [Methylomirabilota bacterium]|nr:NACHT domain-containing protein [Methylomirabilota bacterium]